MIRCEKHGISSNLLKVIGSNKKEIEFDEEELVLHKIDSVFSCKPELLQLEQKAMDLLEAFILGKDVDAPISLKSVFIVITKHWESLNA